MSSANSGNISIGELRDMVLIVYLTYEDDGYGGRTVEKGTVGSFWAKVTEKSLPATEGEHSDAKLGLEVVLRKQTLPTDIELYDSQFRAYKVISRRDDLKYTYLTAVAKDQ